MNLQFTPGSRSEKLAIMVVIIMAVFIGRLFYLQVIQHDEFVRQANQEQIRKNTIYADRGEIYAMNNGTPSKIVMNENVYTVFVDPTHVSEPDRIVASLKRIVGGNTQPNLDALVRVKDSQYQIVAKYVTYQQANMLKEEKLAGLGFQKKTRRVYPETQLAAQVLGFVTDEGEGSYGIEGALDKRLKGENGFLQSVTDVRDVPLTIGQHNILKPVKNGDNIVMTIDMNVQSYAEQALMRGLERTGATNGSVLIMDPQNGHVLAMANAPTYRPDQYGNVKDMAVYNNPIVSVPYEAGSVIKPFTLTIGLDQGVITPDSTYNNTDYITVADRTIKNASLGRKTGVITMQDALNWSFNTGMVTMLQRLGGGQSITYEARKTMYDYYYNKYRFAQATGIELASEADGLLISPDSPNGNAVQYATMTFGQGMNPTMIQVCSAFNMLMNGGTYYQPTIVAGTMNSGTFVAQEGRGATKDVIKPSTAATIQQMVHAARTEFYAGHDRKGFNIGGKTGTSQTIKSDGTYSDTETIATYLGYGGDPTPRYTIMVKLWGKDKNLQGGTDASPVFTDISNWMIDYLKLQPKG